MAPAGAVSVSARAACGRWLRAVDHCRVIAAVNRILRGWVQYFRTGEAAIHFVQVNRVVADGLRGLLLKRAELRLVAGRAQARHRPFFEASGPDRLRGTIRNPGTVHAAS